MRDRKIQRMVMKGEITHAEGERMATAKATRPTKPTPSREEPISYGHYKERFLDTADPDWILTIVDCHI